MKSLAPNTNLSKNYIESITIDSAFSAATWRHVDQYPFYLFFLDKMSSKQDAATWCHSVDVLRWTIVLSGVIRQRISRHKMLIPSHCFQAAVVTTGNESWELSVAREAKIVVILLPINHLSTWLEESGCLAWVPILEDKHARQAMSKSIQSLPFWMESYFASLIRTVNFPSYVSSTKQLNSCLLTLLEISVGSYDRERQMKLPSDEERVLELAASLLEELDTTVSLHVLMHRTGLNALRLQRIFRQLFNQSVANFIATVRIEKAKILLSNTTESILCIALEVGYTSASYFGKVFKQRVGQEPSAYRRFIRDVLDEPVSDTHEA